MAWPFKQNASGKPNKLYLRK